VASTAGSARPRPVPAGGPGHEIEVLEKDTDTSWAMFEALRQQQERGFETTLPASAALLPAAAKAVTVPPAPAVPGVEDVMLEARRNNRVCPKPLIWQRLFEFLPNKPADLPKVPGTRAEWDALPPLHKRSRLREHIEWAAAAGVLPKVHAALQALPEERWHHIGD
jgi:hypothetical protein